MSGADERRPGPDRQARDEKKMIRRTYSPAVPRNFKIHDPACAMPSNPPDPRPLDTLPMEQLRILLKNHPGDWRADTGMAEGRPEPATSLPLPPDARLLDLPHPDSMPLGEMPVKDAIARRRSQRAFSPEPLPLDHLALLLWAAQGTTGAQRAETGEILHRFRAAPSGGARYPLETFLAARNIDGLRPGLYRYLPETHRLLDIRPDPEIGARMHRACYGDPIPAEAAAVAIWAAVPERTEWKYGCIAHKMIAIEAGHACQNLHLAAESLPTGVCPILSYHQPSMDEIIGADSDRIFTIYLAAFGPAEPQCL
jgi:SagB-type dehydrogenase family enzyme